jgi:hypothetical protein
MFGDFEKSGNSWFGRKLCFGLSLQMEKKGKKRGDGDNGKIFFFYFVI